MLTLEPCLLENLLEKVPVNREKVIQVLQWLLDNNVVKFNEEQLLILGH